MPSTIDILKTNQLKMTTLRHHLLKALESSGGYVGPEDIFRTVKGACPSASLSAIYRNLDEFVRTGIVSVIDTTDRQRHYFACASQCGTTHHHHFVCVQCRAVQPVFRCESDLMSQHIASELQGKVLSHFFQINGLCKPCVAKDPPQ